MYSDIKRTKGLNLEGAGVKYSRRDGIFVNDTLQSSNLNIFAAGDVW
jgi:pyruvate/2-oxoglutarate dehydrogenase complex dihydrolipoamide dehydrogenase (E3) component